MFNNNSHSLVWSIRIYYSSIGTLSFHFVKICSILLEIPNYHLILIRVGINSWFSITETPRDRRKLCYFLVVLVTQSSIESLSYRDSIWRGSPQFEFLRRNVETVRFMEIFWVINLKCCQNASYIGRCFVVILWCAAIWLISTGLDHCSELLRVKLHKFI